MDIRTHHRNILAGSLGRVLASGRLGARAATSPLFSSHCGCTDGRDQLPPSGGY